MSSLQVLIRPISPSSTHALRHKVLWPHKPLSYVILEEDDHGWHFGAFLSSATEGEVPISVISCFLEPLPEEGVLSSDLDQSKLPRTGRFRKFATDPMYQGKGVGSALLKHVLDFLTRPELLGANVEDDPETGVTPSSEEGGKGCVRVWCDARWDARGFYERFGMRAIRPAGKEDGPTFWKGDVAYVRMVLDCPEST
ncbi:hypothetical protein DACRYDRAFT_80768 [Dacryopinax primogenitus]|uniref:N-acetyltransferase domain-containing protein n=1 Tax=Dacryopinax primogenitus (strain DJM 731) TaxID=1858805 RepID=M5FXP8_DACPD|nr:uncharacterized protein DACRYDRAFT_80768 [Dacryopinax primogenitus]EJU00560.1 hypothetical protein DACRYDRAFT_80768 [Dacryopinax primogenitus]